MCGTPDMPKIPDPPPPKPEPVSQDVIDEMSRRRDRAKQARGYAGTVLTGPTLNNDDEPRTRRKTLLGG